MKVYQRRSQFGWPGDGGRGLELIRRIKEGAKTASCCPKSLYSPEEERAARDAIGHNVTIVDVDGHPHCNIRVLDVFETTWGLPDPRLVAGEGFDSADAFRRGLRDVWEDLLRERGSSLANDTLLIAELFILSDGVKAKS